MPETITFGIDIASLTEADRFSLFEFRDPATGETCLVQLVNWNPSFCFCAWPGTDHGGPTRPSTLRRLSRKEAPMTFFVIYDRPKDAPEFWVVRRHWLIEDRPIASHYADAKAQTLEAARGRIPAGLTNVGRFREDDPAIFEVWM